MSSRIITQDTINRPRGLDAFLEDLPKTVLENHLAAQNLPKALMPSTSFGSYISSGKQQKMLRKFSSTPDFRQIDAYALRADQSLNRFASHEQLQMALQKVNKTDELDTKQQEREEKLDFIHQESVPSEHDSLKTVDTSDSCRKLFLPLLHILPAEDVLDATIHWNKECRNVVVNCVPDGNSQLVDVHTALTSAAPIDDVHGNTVDISSFDSKANDDFHSINSEPSIDFDQGEVDHPLSNQSTFTVYEQENLLCIEDPVLERTIQEAKEAYNRRFVKRGPHSAFDALYRVLLKDENETDSLFSYEDVRENNKIIVNEPELHEIQESCERHGHVATPHPIDQILPGLSFQSSKTWLSEPKRAGKVLGAIAEWPISRQGLVKLYEGGEKKKAWIMYFVQFKATFMFFYPPDYLTRHELNEPIPPIGYIRLSERSTVDITYRYLKYHRYILSVIRVGTDEYIRKVLDEPEVNFIEFSSEQKLVSWALDLRKAIEMNIASEARLSAKTKSGNVEQNLRHKASAPFRVTSRTPKSNENNDLIRGKAWPAR